MLPDKIEHCIVFMNYWDVSGVFWSFSKCNIKIPHLPADPSIESFCVLVGKMCERTELSAVEIHLLQTRSSLSWG